MDLFFQEALRGEGGPLGNIISFLPIDESFKKCQYVNKAFYQSIFSSLKMFRKNIKRDEIEYLKRNIFPYISIEKFEILLKVVKKIHCNDHHDIFKKNVYNFVLDTAKYGKLKNFKFIFLYYKEFGDPHPHREYIDKNENFYLKTFENAINHRHSYSILKHLIESGIYLKRIDKRKRNFYFRKILKDKKRCLNIIKLLLKIDKQLNLHFVPKGDENYYKRYYNYKTIRNCLGIVIENRINEYQPHLIELIKLLLSHKTITFQHHNYVYFKKVLNKGNYSISKLFLEYYKKNKDQYCNKKINFNEIIKELIAYNKNVSIINLIFKESVINFEEDDFYLIRLFCLKGRLDLIKSIEKNSLNLTINYNIKDSECFYNACVGNHIDIIKFLIEKNTKITIRSLRLVCSTGNFEIYNLIMKNSNLKPNCDCLIYAVVEENMKILNELLIFEYSKLVQMRVLKFVKNKKIKKMIKNMKILKT